MSVPFECCRRLSSDSLATQYQDVCATWPPDNILPLVYHERYNITWMGLQNLSSLDACKPRNIILHLQGKGLVSPTSVALPSEAADEVLLRVHDPNYLNKLKSWNLRIAQVTETPSLVLLPNSLLQSVILSPLRYQTAGTILAAALAVQRGWSINLGGGFHHGCWNEGRAWCAFADISLAIQRIREASSGAVKRVLLIDLDAHQGNGVQRDKLHQKDHQLTIVDMHTCNIFPRDDDAMQAIDVQVELQHGTKDAEYLQHLEGALQRASTACPKPDLIIYIAGADVLESDKSGRLSVSPAGLIARDERVFRYALQREAPICMLLGGGNTYGAAQVVADSISNLFIKFRLGSTSSAGAVEMSPLMTTGAADSVVPA